MREIGVAEVGQIRLDHRSEPQFRLAPGKRVTKAAARAQCRGAGGQDTDGRKVVGGDLEQFRRVGQAMHLVEDYSFAAQGVQKSFRVFHRPPDARQLAIEILDRCEGLGQPGLASAAHAPQPKDGAAAPFPLNAFEPKTTLYHRSS